MSRADDLEEKAEWLAALIAKDAPRREQSQRGSLDANRLAENQAAYRLVESGSSAASPPVRARQITPGWMLAIVVAGGLSLFGAIQDDKDTGGASAWTGRGTVCDFNGDCQDTFRCRENNGTTEIYLPTGSFSSGNTGWQWEQDVGTRC